MVLALHLHVSQAPTERRVKAMAGQSSYLDASAFVPKRRSRGTYACGDRIANKYQLIREVNHGGMGVLWAAHNLRLDAHVALKFIRAENESSRAAVRLLREARATARLDHPSIVRVFDFDETAEGQPFIVMELLDGYSLGDLLEKTHRAETTDALRMLLPIADALAAMHDKGIVHRDVKPENIFLAYDDAGRLRPKLLDFGIARLDASPTCTTSDGSYIIGSPDYMAPEQVLCETVDARTDVWAFAVVIYEMVTGIRPFESGNGLDRLFRTILERTAPPITHYDVGDADLADIVSRALAKDRRDRWPSMRAFGTALARWLVEQGVETDICGASLAEAWRLVSGRPGSPEPMPTVGRAFEPTLSAPHTSLAPATRARLSPVDPRKMEAALSATLVSGNEAVSSRIETNAVVLARPHDSRSRTWLIAACVGGALVFLGPAGYASWQSARQLVFAAELASPLPDVDVESPVTLHIAERATELLIVPAAPARSILQTRAQGLTPADGASSASDPRRTKARRTLTAAHRSSAPKHPTAGSGERDRETSVSRRSITRLDDLMLPQGEERVAESAAPSRAPLEVRR